MSRAAAIARAALAPIALGVARARAAPARWLLPALGVALAAGLLGTAAGGGVVAGEQAARDAVSGLPPAGRTIRLTWSAGLPTGVDARGRALLRRMTPAPQTRSVLLLATAVAPAGRPATTSPVQLAGIAPLPRWVRLRSGRLPRTCTPRRCEVVAAGGGRAPAVVERNGTRLVTVGRAVLTSAGPLGFTPARAGSAAGARPLLLAADPSAVDALTGFGSVFRTHGWSAPMRTGGRPSWRLGELAARWNAVRATVTSTADGFALDAPEQALQTARARARKARRRTVLVGAGAAALLAGFVVLAATALRRDLADERGRLERRGARGAQLAALSVTEAAIPATAGIAAGLVAAVAITALRADAAGVPAAGAVAHAFATGGAPAAVALTWLAAVVLLVLAARDWGPAAGRAFDVAAVGAAAVVAVLLVREDRAGAPGDVLPALLAPLVCLVAALLVARLAVPALRGLEAAGRRGPLPVRLAGLGLARAPAGPALTIAVVAVGCGLSCFAWAYRETLHRGDRDQAAYAVPLDVTVRAGTGLVPPLSLAPERRWRALAPGGAVLPVQRTSASVPRGATAVELPLLGVPAGGLRAIRGWRDGDASASRTALARRLRLAGAGETRGPVVRRGDRALDVTVAARGDAVDITALLAAADGSVVELPLGAAGATPEPLHAELPRSAAGRRLVGLAIARQSGLAATGGHQQAENTAAPATTGGTLTVEDARLGGRPVDLRAWRGHGPLTGATARDGALRAAYRFDRGGRALLAPPQPGDGRTLPVVTDRATAASAGPRGILPLTVLGERLRARVVGTVARFPTVDANAEGVVVADRAALAAVLSARAPGIARPGELWIAVPPGAPEERLLAALRAPPFTTLDVASRRAGEQRLRADPLARELVRTLAGAAVVALALAALGVLVAVALALRDDAAELVDLEALGVPPRLLRAEVRLRALLLAAAGLACGLALAIVLTGLVVDAVRATAAGVVPVPPLVAEIPVGAWAGSAVTFVLAVVVGAALLTRRALGGRTPRRMAGAGASS